MSQISVSPKIRSGSTPVERFIFALGYLTTLVLLLLMASPATAQATPTPHRVVIGTDTGEAITNDLIVYLKNVSDVSNPVEANVGRFRASMQQGITVGADANKLNTDLGNLPNPGTVPASNRHEFRNFINAQRADQVYADSTSTGQQTIAAGETVYFTDISQHFVNISGADQSIQLRLIPTSSSFTRAHLPRPTTAELDAGNSNDERAFSPQNVHDMIDIHAPTPAGGGDFDIHDDISRQRDISSSDRIIFSDEGSQGDPNAYDTAGSIRDFMQEGIQAGGLDQGEVDARIASLRPNRLSNAEKTLLGTGIEDAATQDQTPQEIYDAVDGIAQNGWELPGTAVAANPPGPATGPTLANLQIDGTIYPLPVPNASIQVVLKPVEVGGRTLLERIGYITAAGRYQPNTGDPGINYYVGDSGGWTFAPVAAHDFAGTLIPGNLYIGGGAPVDPSSGQSTFFVTSLSDLPPVSATNLGHQFFVLQDGLERVAINDPVTTTAPDGTFNPIAPRADIHIVGELPPAGVLGSFYFLNSGNEHQGWYRWINFGGSVHDYEETSGRAALGLSRTVDTQHAEWLGAFASTEDALEFTHSVESTTDYFYLDTNDNTIKLLDQTTFVDAGTVFDNFGWRVIGGQTVAPPAPPTAAPWTLLYSENVNLSLADVMVLPSSSVAVPDDAVSLLLNFGSISASSVTRSGEFFEIPVDFWKANVTPSTHQTAIGGDNYIIVRDFIRSSESSSLTGRDIQIGRTAQNHLLFGSETASEDIFPLTVYYKVPSTGGGTPENGGSGLNESEVDARITTLRPNPFSNADESKLDGIQSGAEQNIGVEFTSALRDKLNDIESGAEQNIGVEYTQSEKSKLDDIESNATRDQSGSQIVSSIDNQLGNADWQSGSSTFNIHDDISNNRQPSVNDRYPFADEGSSGDPNAYATGTQMRQMITGTSSALGSVSTVDQGDNQGQVPLLQSGGVFDEDRIPQLLISKIEGLQAQLDAVGGGLSAEQTWTRSSDFVADRVYHTDITPPTDCTMMFVTLIVDTGDGNSVPATATARYAQWNQLSAAASDNASYSPAAVNTYIGFVNARLAFSDPLQWFIGKTSGGQIAVGIDGEHDPDERGLRLQCL